jgi:transcriptional regulator with XRE-family HTH domain
LNDESRTVLRRRLREQLRRLRSGARLTQEQVAEHLSWSLSKVVRIEAGTVNVSSADLDKLLDLYGITSQSERERIHAINPRQQKWWSGYDNNIKTSAAAYLGWADESFTYADRFDPGISGSLNTSASSNLKRAVAAFSAERDKWITFAEEPPKSSLSLASGLSLRVTEFIANNIISAINRILVSLKTTLGKLAPSRRLTAIHTLISELIITVLMCHRHSREPVDIDSPSWSNIGRWRVQWQLS